MNINIVIYEASNFYNATMYTMMNESTTNVRCDPKSNRSNDNICLAISLKQGTKCRTNSLYEN